MNKLALTLPGGQSVASPQNFSSSYTDLGSFVSAALNLAIVIAGVLLFFWMIWGVFQYIYAGGDKENLGKARSRITLALVGFIIVIIALAISQFAKTIIPPRENQPITPVSTPK